MYCARTLCRDLYITGFIMYKFKVKLMLVWMTARRRAVIRTKVFWELRRELNFLGPNLNPSQEKF